MYSVRVYEGEKIHDSYMGPLSKSGSVSSTDPGNAEATGGSIKYHCLNEYNPVYSENGQNSSDVMKNATTVKTFGKKLSYKTLDEAGSGGCSDVFTFINK